MTEFQVMLSPEQSESLQKYIYKLTHDTVERVRREAALNKEWLRKGEACEYIDIARTTLDRWIAKGLKVSTVNGVQLISKQAINEFLIEHQI